MYIKVTVTPGAKQEKLTVLSADRFALAVRERAERNAANDRVREVLASRFGVAVGQVRIVTGARSRSKILSVNL